MLLPFKNLITIVHSIFIEIFNILILYHNLIKYVTNILGIWISSVLHKKMLNIISH